MAQGEAMNDMVRRWFDRLLDWFDRLLDALEDHHPDFYAAGRAKATLEE